MFSDPLVLTPAGVQKNALYEKGRFIVF